MDTGKSVLLTRWHYSQEPKETTHVPLHGGRNKHNVVCLHGGILFGLKKERQPDTGLQQGQTRNTVPNETGQTQKDTASMTAPVRVPEQTNPQTQKGSEVSRSWGGGQGGAGAGGTQGLVGAEFLFGKTRKFWRWTVLTAARECECNVTPRNSARKTS